MSTNLQTLMEMGFSKTSVERALAETNNKGVNEAMDWLLAHEGELQSEPSESQHSDKATDDSGNTLQTEASGGLQLQAKSLKCDECNKLLSSEDAVQMHAARTGHSQFSESVEEIKPLTEEEKQAQLLKLQELMKVKRLEREEKERKEQLEREKNRRVHGKEMISVKQKMQEDEMKKIMEERRRDREAEKLARQRVREQIEKDKLDRAAKFGASGSQSSSTSAGAVAEQSSGTSQSASASDVPKTPAPVPTETNLQIRLFSGDTITQKFGVNEPLAAVRLFVHSKLTNGEMSGDFTGITFASAYPRKVFTEDDMMVPLSKLGLVPSAALLLTKAAKS